MNQTPNMNRRRVLVGIAAASTAAAPVVLAAGGPTASAENPELLAADNRLAAARAELAEATDALEWLADEWRHRWPLAPEELLGAMNAHHSAVKFSGTVERDIVNRPLMRDLTVLTKRLDRRYRQGRNCFHVDAPDKMADCLKRWRANKPVGRTAKTLARNQASRARIIKDLEKRLPLSRAYYAETERLRKAAGAPAAVQRVKDASAAIGSIEAEIGKLPAFTMAGLTIKAAALKAAYEQIGIHGLSGFLGDSYRLAAAIVDVSEGVS